MCAYVRQDVTSRLHPRTAVGRIDAEAYLQHHLHADEVVRKLHELVGTDDPLPLDGILLTVHARYDTAASPPEEMVVAGCWLGPQPKRRIHLFNYTGCGTGGFHYDLLC